MTLFGTLTLHLFVLLTAWGIALALAGIARREMRLVRAAQLTGYAVCVTASLALCTLAYAFAISDFSNIYVQQHSDRTMPLFYRITAIWGGMEGSLLLWAWLLSLFSAIALRLNSDRFRESLPHFIVVLMSVLLFFGVLLVTTSNPFGEFLSGTMSTGKGMNPLLQNPYMVTHPPALYLGFVGMTIPFALAIAALWSGNLDDTWILAARPWAIGAWYCLSLGLTLGMLWAYEELGWGGYWGWDPVENAGFMPWLTATAFIHSIMVQERRHMLKIWNFILAILTFILTIFGTFLTRSGFIESVHAFARSSIGWVFLGYIAFVAAIGVALIVWRRPFLRSRGELESIASREFWFLLNNWVLLTGAFLVLVLTTFPKLSEAWGETITISIPAFNRWMVPVGIALLIITGIGPMLGWRKTTLDGIRKQFFWPISVSLVVFALLALLIREETIALVTWSLTAFVLVTIVQELVRAIRVRQSGDNTSIIEALLWVIGRNRRRYGGYIVHAGMMLMYIGFAGEAFKIKEEVVLSPGQRREVGIYTLRYDSIDVTRDAQKEMITAKLTVFKQGELLGELQPARWIFFKHEDSPTTEVAIRRSMRDDLFVALQAPDFQQGNAAFMFVVNPLVNWIWIGFLLMTVGAIVSALPIAFTSRQRALAKTIVPLLLFSIVTVAAFVPQATFADENAASSSMQPYNHSGEVKFSTSSNEERDVFSKFSCMCGGCPKLPLDSCPCGFAGQERDAIREKIKLGWNEQQITDWYTQKRGPEIGKAPFGLRALTMPPDRGINRLYWLAPYGLSGAAIVLLFFVGRRWVKRKHTESHASAQVSETDPAHASSKVYQDLLNRELKNLD